MRLWEAEAKLRINPNDHVTLDGTHHSVQLSYKDGEPVVTIHTSWGPVIIQYDANICGVRVQNNTDMTVGHPGKTPIQVKVT